MSTGVVSKSISYAPHDVRTAKEPRQEVYHNVKISKIHQVNSSVRLVQLQLANTDPPFTHHPGQWLDVHIPSIPQAGGFTIISAPLHAAKYRFLELAIQKAPNNAPATFLWRPEGEILDTQLQVRVGGRFIYPPPDLSVEQTCAVDRIIFVAGGVGINPIMSMLKNLYLESYLMPDRIPSQTVLYSVRAKPGEAILFYEHITRMLEARSRGSRTQNDHDFDAKLYLTGSPGWTPNEISEYERLNNDLIQRVHGRIKPAAILDALGPSSGRKNTVAYVCGPPKMTDEFVEELSKADGMNANHVLCERWW